MASGKLGSATPSANTNTIVYTVPALKSAALNVAIVNRGSSDAVVNVAISTSGTPTSADYIEYGVTIPANGILERTAIVAGAGEHVVVHSSTADCSVRVHGCEENEEAA